MQNFYNYNGLNNFNLDSFEFGFGYEKKKLDYLVNKRVEVKFVYLFNGLCLK